MHFMPDTKESFEELLHTVVHESIEKDERFWNRYGKYKRWDWYAGAVTLTFFDPDKPTLQIDVSVVGTTKEDKWQWTWANRNFEPNSKLGMDEVRKFGESHGYELLTTGFIDSDEHTGWEMTSVALHVLDGLGSYRFPTDEGFCYLVFLKIQEILAG
jgi:hypothetical protein